MRLFHRTTTSSRSAVRLTPSAEHGGPLTLESPELRRLRQAIQAHDVERLLGRTRDAEAARALRAGVRDLADAARGVDPVRAELLLLSLKRAWGSLPELQAVPPGGPREALWDRVVALCVQEFYAPAHAPAASCRSAGSA